MGGVSKAKEIATMLVNDDDVCAISPLSLQRQWLQPCGGFKYARIQVQKHDVVQEGEGGWGYVSLS